MNMFILDHEAGIRLAFFFGIFLVMAVWELAAPKRVLTASKPGRWIINLVITALNALALRVLFPLQAVGVALIVRDKGWGLLNLFPAPEWLGAAPGNDHRSAPVPRREQTYLPLLLAMPFKS